MNKRITELTRYFIKGSLVGEIVPSKIDSFLNELNTLIIKYCGEKYYLSSEVEAVDSETYKSKTEEINEKESEGLVTCPYTSEWCDKLKDKELKSTFIPPKTT